MRSCEGALVGTNHVASGECISMAKHNFNSQCLPFPEPQRSMEICTKICEEEDPCMCSCEHVPVRSISIWYIDIGSSPFMDVTSVEIFIDTGVYMYAIFYSSWLMSYHDIGLGICYVCVGYVSESCGSLYYRPAGYALPIRTAPMWITERTELLYIRSFLYDPSIMYLPHTVV